MPEAANNVCDECKMQAATVFLTKIVGGVSQKQNLCRDCYAAVATPQEMAIEDAIQHGCAYCGAPAVGAGSHGTNGPIATCAECAKAAHEFMLAALGFTPEEMASGEEPDPLSKLKEMSPEAKAEAIQKMNGVEEYMRRRRQK